MPPKTPFDDLDQTAFEEVVNKECRGSVPEAVARGLRNPEVARRWYTALVRIKHSVEGQLAAKTGDLQRDRAKLDLGEMTKGEYLERMKQYQQWRSGVIRFRTSVEQRIQEARLLMPPTSGDGHDSLALASEFGRLKEKVDMAMTVLQFYEQDRMAPEAALSELRKILIRRAADAFHG